MRFSAGQAALKFNKLGPVHFIDERANIEIRSRAAELKRGHAALLSNNPNTGRWQPYLKGALHLPAQAPPPTTGVRACASNKFETRRSRHVGGGLGLGFRFAAASGAGVQFKAAPYRLRTAIHRLPISSCGAAANVAPHFHKAAALTGWCRSHRRIAAYLHGIRSFRVSFRSNAVAVPPLVMHIRATTVNARTMRLPSFAAPFWT